MFTVQGPGYFINVDTRKQKNTPKYPRAYGLLEFNEKMKLVRRQKFYKITLLRITKQSKYRFHFWWNILL